MLSRKRLSVPFRKKDRNNTIYLRTTWNRFFMESSPVRRDRTQMSRLSVPTDRERNLPLLSLREPARRLDDVILSDDTRSTLEEILQEHHHSERLRSYGLRAADRLLFYGPPGCGKTLTAEVVASELSLPPRHTAHRRRRILVPRGDGFKSAKGL